MGRLAAVALLSIPGACATAHSSALATGPTTAAPHGVVSVLLSRNPLHADELGIIEAHGTRPGTSLEKILDEFRSRVESLGGDVARVDAFSTRYEIVSEPYTYECGYTETTTETRTESSVGPDGSPTTSTVMVPVTQYVSRTCTGYRSEEVAVLTVTGRAFRSERGHP
jgi:hypothetical protein